MEAKSKYHRLVFVPAVCLAVLAILFWARVHTPGAFRIFPLSFNPFALLSFFATGLNILLLLKINSNKNKDNTTLWYLLFVASLAIWGLCEGLQRLTPGPEAAMFWSITANIGVALMPVSFFMFTVHYTNREGMVRQAMTWVLVMVSMLGLLYMNAATDLLATRAPSRAAMDYWGYYAPNGPLFWAYLLWIEAFFISGLAMLIRHFRATTNQLRRAQTKLFIISVSIPLVIGTITDGILPIIGINPLPTAVVASSFMALVIAYGIRLYGLFNINPATIAVNILDTMNEGVVVTDADYRIQSINRGAAKLLGIDEDAAMGRPILQIFSPACRSDIQAAIGEEMAHKSFAKLPECTIDRAGTEALAVSASISRVEGGDGVAGYILVLSDITLQKKLMVKLQQEHDSVERKVIEQTHVIREEQAKFQASIQSLQLGFLLVEPDGRISKINRAAMDLLNPDGLIAGIHSLNEVFKLEHIKAVNTSLQTRQPIIIREALVGAKYLSLFITPIIIGNQVIGTVVVLEDVTEQKVLQRSRDEFFSIASHELRTPLTAIRGNTAMIKSYFQDQIKDKDLIAMIDDIYGSSVRLIEMVNDFLDASRLEQGKMEFKLENFAIGDVITEVLKDMTATLNGRDIKLIMGESFGQLPAVYADRNKVKQVVYNLLGNALKFTDKGSVTLDGMLDGDHIRIRVTDTGRGIPVGEQVFLFHKFQQAEKNILTRDTTRGTGLGLYISRKLIHGMGGIIDLESSQEGKGSVFYFTLPIARTDSIANKKTVATALS